MNSKQTHLRRGGTQSREGQWATNLGWFSIGLGAAEVIAPRTMAKLIGLNGSGKPSVLRAYGLREIAAGVGILSQPKPVGWMWGRVAGDIMDLATLRSAARDGNVNRGRVAAATTAVLGVTALDVLCSAQLTRTMPSSPDGRARATRTIIIDRSPQETWEFWHNLENLPAVLSGIVSVQVLQNKRSHWTMKTPLGRTVQWTAETIVDEPGAHIAWRSLDDSDIAISGSVWFDKAPGDRGTLVRVQIEYGPSLPAFIGKAADLAGVGAGDAIEQILRRFKQVLETGEIVKSDASVHWTPHPAQPARQTA